MSGLRRVFLRLASVLVGSTMIGHAAGQTVLSRAAIERAGIVVETLHPARVARSLPAMGVVLDPAPLYRLRGDIAAAKAAVEGAKAKVTLDQKLSARSAQLYQGRLISALDYEKVQGDLTAAAIALAEAQANHEALLAEAGAHWGAAMAAALQSGGDPLPQLASGKAILVGLSLPPGAGLADPPRQVEAEMPGVSIALRLIGPVPDRLGGYPGRSFLYQAAAQPEAPVGAAVSAQVAAGRERAGVVVPRSAVLWRGGRALVFRAGAGNRFDPVPIATDIAAPGGYFVSAGLGAGDRIVVGGAALLLGASETPRPNGEDED